MSTYTFQINKQYKRSEIKAAIGLDPSAKGGNWDTGYATYSNGGWHKGRKMCVEWVARMDEKRHIIIGPKS
jgi:hypothetical protein